MVSLSEFMPYVLPSVPGCTDVLAEQYLRDVCIDFCSKTLLIQRDHDPVSVVAGQADYDLDPPTGARVHMVMQAWFERQPLDVVTPDSPGMRPEVFNSGFQGADTNTGNPTKLIQKDDLTFTLERAPSVDSISAVTMRIALKPTRNATDVENILLDDYAYEIGQGAAARLMRIPGQPFTNIQLALAYETTYVTARNTAQARANRSYGRGTQQVQMRRL
jgi:hypothetical protein